MSGLEIAGVVLGVIPIVQIGIEQIKGKRLKALIKHQQTIASFSRKFELEHALFHANLEKLLVSISDEETASILLVNLTGPGWKDDDLSESLQEHLGERSYQAYYSALTDLAALLAELQEELGLDDSGNQIRVDKWSDKVAKRIKDYIKHKNHLSVLETIKELNEALHRLTGDVLELAPIRANRRTKLDTKRWESLRKLAENLHDTY
ncbi:hypothetical protein EJ08DRAFT_484327 [Tothia fuscella]|uniref:Uncharacterized protein n=1 Tax=Tothia fuscella TaxID=1048955 RepID=A0A9P4TTZ9_9PEZI|nr:hypothetical protein EJ08DRAFT_484327 [Tothia fuscella]